MANKKVTKKPVAKKPVAAKKIVKKTNACKCTPKCKCTKVQKVSIKSVKKPVVQEPVKKSFWKRVGEFFGF